MEFIFSLQNTLISCYTSLTIHLSQNKPSAWTELGQGEGTGWEETQPSALDQETGLDVPISGAVAAPSREPTFPEAGLCSGEAAGPAARSSGGVVKSKCTGDLALYLPSWETSLGEDVWRGAAEQMDEFPRRCPSKEHWAHTWGGIPVQAGDYSLLTKHACCYWSHWHVKMFSSLFHVYFPNREYRGCSQPKTSCPLQTPHAQLLPVFHGKNPYLQLFWILGKSLDDAVGLLEGWQ